MSKILINTTASDVDILDTGVTVPASGQYTLNPTEYDLFAESSDVIILISDVPNPTLIVNDGSFDLSISAGVDLIKGIFPTSININSINGSNTTDSMLGISGDDILGHNSVHKFGHNSNMGSSAFETIWHNGGLYPWSINAERVNIVSTDIVDTSVGLGARTIQLIGLDASYNEITEIITLNGTTNVLSVNSYLRLQRAKVLSAGSHGHNNGELTATQETSGDILFNISHAKNQTLICTYTVPAGKTAYLIDWQYSIKNGKATDLELLTRKIGEVFQVKSKIGIDTTGNQTWLPYLRIPEKTDVDVRGKATTGAHEISSSLNIILVDN